MPFTPSFPMTQLLKSWQIIFFQHSMIFAKISKKISSRTRTLLLLLKSKHREKASVNKCFYKKSAIRINTVSPIFLFIDLYNKITKHKHRAEKNNVEGCENKKISAALSGVMLGIFAKGNKAGKRGDNSAAATDVYTKQKLSVIVGKLG